MHGDIGPSPIGMTEDFTARRSLAKTSRAEKGIRNLDMRDHRLKFDWHRFTMCPLFRDLGFRQLFRGRQRALHPFSMGRQVKGRHMGVVVSLKFRLMDRL